MNTICDKATDEQIMKMKMAEVLCPFCTQNSWVFGNGWKPVNCEICDHDKRRKGNKNGLLHHER